MNGFLRSSVLAVLAASLGLLLSACGSNTSPPAGGSGGSGGSGTDSGTDAGAGDSGPPPTAADVQAIVTAHFCADCHIGGQPNLPGSMDLSDISSRAQIVGVASVECATKVRIVAGHPETSYLVDKLLGSSQQSGGCFAGGQMPLANTPLTADEMATIGRWITAGALP